MERRCPTCRTPIKPRGENPAFPFCSSRCRMVDLGNWMAGSYVMSRPVDPDRDGEAIERAAATVAEDSPDIEH